MLTRFAITRRADDDGVGALVAERDYVLAHIVAQLHRAKPTDGGQLVFKGGTALRLVHFGDYRYSADLDFTIIGGNAIAATASLVEVLDAARRHAGRRRACRSTTARSAKSTTLDSALCV